MKRLSISLLTTALTVAALSGCYRTRINFRSSAELGTPARDWDERYYHNFVFGLAEISRPIQLDEVCPSGALSAEQSTTFVAGLIEVLAQNLYNPQAVTVYCASGSAQHVVLDNDGQVVALLERRPVEPEATH